jgi:anti-anti-sigma regulatory factor
MVDSFLLLVFPMRTLTIHLGGHRDCLGLSLRGGCTTAADANNLTQAITQLLAKGVAKAWIDCRGLHSINWVGQQALVQADKSARACSTVLYWCGLPHDVHKQLVDGGLATTMELLPAAAFQGPQFLLSISA